jgi:ABC-2 type transport system ATP-binding protein
VGSVHGPVISLRGVRVEPPPEADAGRAPLLDDVALDVFAGEVVLVVGRRGSGVTTLLDVAAGRRRCSRGRVEVAGRPAGLDPAALADVVAVLPSHAALFDHLTVRETVGLWACLHPAPHDPAEVLALADLEDVADRAVRTIGHAAQQRLQLAVTFVGGKPVVVCDEPAGGSAPGTTDVLARLLTRHRALGGTALVAGGPPDVLAPAVVAVADRVAVLRRGRVVAVASPAEVVERFVSYGAVEVVLADPAEAAALTSAVPGATFARVGDLTRVDLPDCAPDRLETLTGRLGSVVEVRHHDASLAHAVRRATADRRTPVAPLAREGR